MTDTQQNDRMQRKTRNGIVLRNSMTKTVVVDVERHEMHPLYNRVVTKTSTYLAHDEKSECGVGDLVEIMETRPLSKRKRWRVARILKKAE